MRLFSLRKWCPAHILSCQADELDVILTYVRINCDVPSTWLEASSGRHIGGMETVPSVPQTKKRLTGSGLARGCSGRKSRGGVGRDADGGFSTGGIVSATPCVRLCDFDGAVCTSGSGVSDVASAMRWRGEVTAELLQQRGTSAESFAERPLLQVEGASISIGDVCITKDVSFSIGRGERVGLVGESGCGKTLTGLSLLRLLPAKAKLDGRILFEGEDLVSMDARRLRQVRGDRIAMIFQEPMSALDPVFTIGEQIAEGLRLHRQVPRRECRAAAIEALREVGIPAPERRHDEYPHQLSGGMKQRAMIAMALICRPRLLIADEPTTALDVTIQAQITDLLCRLSEETGAALLFITHDLGVVAETCTRMLAMYAGQIVEDAPVDDVLIKPMHPYTSGLLRSLPRLNQKRGELAFIPGRVPAPSAMPDGCRFYARCAFAADGCSRPQDLAPAPPARLVRCHRHAQLDLGGVIR